MEIINYIYVITTLVATSAEIPKHKLKDLVSIGISARENGQVYMAGESYFLHTIIHWNRWNTVFSNVNKRLNEVKLSAEAALGMTEVAKAYVATIALQSTKLEQQQRYFLRQIEATHAATHPAWSKLLRHRTMVKPDAVTAVPKLADNSHDIWLTVTECSAYTAFIEPTIELDVSTLASSLDSWKTAINPYLAAIDEMNKGFIQFNYVFNDLRNGRFPLMCLTTEMWTEILKAANVKSTAIGESLKLLMKNIAILPTTDVTLNTDKNLELTTILPIPPDNQQLIFTLYYVGTTPIPYTQNLWMEYISQTWVAVNKGRTWVMYFDNLEQLNEGCITANNIRWCFESFPILILTSHDCWALSLAAKTEPGLECFTKPKKNQQLDVIDVEANTYLISSGVNRDIMVTCPAAIPAAKPRVEKRVFKAGVNIYEMPQKCSAVVSNYYLPANWYIPTTDGTSTKLLSDLSQLVDDTTYINNQIDNSGADTSSVNLQVDTTSQIGRVNSIPKTPIMHKATSTEISAVTVSQPTEKPAAQASSDRTTTEQIFKTVKDWIEVAHKTLDVGDTLAISASFTALFISTILAIRDIYRNCCKQTTTRQHRSDPDVRVGSWFATRRRDNGPLPDIPLLAAPAAVVLPESDPSPRRKHRSQPTTRIRSRSHNASTRRQTTMFRVGSHHVRIDD